MQRSPAFCFSISELKDAATFRVLFDIEKQLQSCDGIYPDSFELIRGGASSNWHVQLAGATTTMAMATQHVRKHLVLAPPQQLEQGLHESRVSG